MFPAGMGGKMGHGVPMSAGPSQREDLCVSPGQSTSSQEAQIQDYEGSGSPLAYL